MPFTYSKHDSKCVGFSDADWGGDLDDRKSTSGFVFQVGGIAISWRSKKQLPRQNMSLLLVLLKSHCGCNNFLQT